MHVPTPSENEAEREIPLIDDEALARLDEFLDSEQVDAEALDIFSAHGFLVALAISPRPMEPGQWIPILFNGEPTFNSDDERNDILRLFEELNHNAGNYFAQGLMPEMPFDPDIEEIPQESPAAAWCAGFMEAVFLAEEAWFGEHEEQAAKLLLPFMALSGLFADEDPELASLAGTTAKATSIAHQLPELCLDLYLLYRAPKEKPAPTKTSKSQPNKGKDARKRGKKKKQR